MSRSEFSAASNAYPPVYHQSSPQPGHSPEYHYDSHNDTHHTRDPRDTHDQYAPQASRGTHEPRQLSYGYAPNRGRSESQTSLTPGAGLLAPQYDNDRGVSAGANLSRAASRRSILERVGVVPEGDTPEDFPPGWTAEDEAAEKEFIKSGMFDWNAMRSWRFWIRKEWWCEFSFKSHKRTRWSGRRTVPFVQLSGTTLTGNE